MRLIDADTLKNLPFERMIHTDFGETAIPIEEIDNAPTVEIPTELCKGCRFLKDCETCEEKLRPQGEWIFNTTHWNCSVCNKTVKTIGYCGTEEFMYENFRFCPNCGAKMKI